MLLGIDEAGRGPVVGPLVLCGVWISPAKENKLLDLGVKDSKRFGSSLQAQKERLALAQEIRKLATCVIILSVDAREVDRRVHCNELNRLEQELAQTLIDQGPSATQIIADGNRLFHPLTDRYPQLQARDKADALFPVVAAASIIAKAERDLTYNSIIAQYTEEFGPIRGGGYANQRTADFLRAYFNRYGQLPQEVRHSYSWPILRQLDSQHENAIFSTRQLELTLAEVSESD